MIWDIQDLVNAALATVARHRLDKPGAYQRWLWQNEKNSRALGLNEYGCADAANLLYTLNAFPQEADERAGWIAVLRELQHPEDGLYHEATHHVFHTTAHCIAALELFDARPQHSLRGMATLKDPSAARAYLDALEWDEKPWPASHRGAGIYAALVLAGEVDRAWEEAYFSWLWEEADPLTGFWRRNYTGPQTGGGLFSRLAGTFHYLFNQEYARRPLRYPAAMVDTCLQVRRENAWPSLGRNVSFAEIDWVFCLTRALRQSGHRFEEGKEALQAFAGQYIPWLQSLDKNTHDQWNDLHSLFGASCALAELQAALPGQLRNEKPLRLVLDRRPFI